MFCHCGVCIIVLSDIILYFVRLRVMIFLINFFLWRYSPNLGLGLPP
jgi:hypothetical protein